MQSTRTIEGYASKHEASTQSRSTPGSSSTSFHRLAQLLSWTTSCLEEACGANPKKYLNGWRACDGRRRLQNCSEVAAPATTAPEAGEALDPQPPAHREAQHAETCREHHQGGRRRNVVVPDEILVLPASVSGESTQIRREAAEPSQP